MTIAFPTIPLPFLPPLYYADIVPGGAPFSSSLRMLMIGLANGDWDAVTNSPEILSGNRPSELYGQGSMLDAMYQTARAQAPYAEIWGMCIAPQGGATFPQAYINVNRSAWRSGPLLLRIAGQPLSAVVRNGDTADIIALRLRAAINSRPYLPVTAHPFPGQPTRVLLKCKWKGATGNEILIEKTWVGMGTSMQALLDVVSWSSYVPGVGATDGLPGLAALGKMRFDVIACRTGVIGDNLIQDFMDGLSGRWAPNQQLYGHFFTALKGSLSGLVTYGQTLNDPHHTTMGVHASASPSWLWAAAVGAHATAQWAEPPNVSLPLQTLELKGILPPGDLANVFDAGEEQSLLSNGISTYVVDDARVVRIGRLVTHRRVNDWGDLDASWRDAITMFQTMYFARRMRQAITNTFPRAALTDKDTGIPGFASPSRIADLYVHEYKAMAISGLVENADIFEASLIVERNANDPNRVDSLIKPDFVNQLRIVANLIETFLETSAAAA